MKLIYFSLGLIALALGTAMVFPDFATASSHADFALATATMAVAVPVVAPDMFSQFFQPKVQFPRWFQPDPEIGAILVHSQEEEDELKARDWTPKPVPGSENAKPIPKTQADLDTALANLAEQQAAFFAERKAVNEALDARMAALDQVLADAMARASDASRSGTVIAEAEAEATGTAPAANTSAKNAIKK